MQTQHAQILRPHGSHHGAWPRWPSLVLCAALIILGLAPQGAAQAGGADYVNIGPIFPTGTKEHSAPLGPDAIRRIAPHLHIPFTVMGGINLTNIDIVVAVGARLIAVVTAVTQADDMAAAVRALRARIPGAA